MRIYGFPNLHGIDNKLIILLLPLVLLTGCTGDKEDLGKRISDSLTDALTQLIDDSLWEEDRQQAPTVEELIEQGEIEEYDYSMEGAGEEMAAGTMELGREPEDKEIELATRGMLRYSYSKLSESERELYKEIYTVLYNHTSEVTLASLDADEVDRVFQLVMNDHPEIFYVTGYSMNKYMQGDVTVSLEFDGTYDKSADEAEEARKSIDDYVEKCLSGMPACDSDYDRVKYIYEYLIENTEYDLAAKDNQNILSVFTSGRTVCQGYAKATQYLLNELDIPCLLVTGMVKDGEPHAWNLACVDGVWTYIDTTWGDASYRNLTTGDTWNEISYDYLCAGEDEFFGTHHISALIDLPTARKIR